MATFPKHLTLLDKEYGITGTTPFQYGIWNHNGSDIVHDHHFIEIAIILAGRGEHYSIIGNQQLAPGHAIILRPGAWHAYRKCRNLQVFNILLSSAFLEQNFHFARQNPLLHFLLWSGPFMRGSRGILSLRLSPPLLNRCRSYIDTMESIRLRSGPTPLLSATGNLLLILACLTESLDDTQIPRKIHIHRSVLATIKLLEENFSYNWTLQELSSAVHLNHHYLVRLFKQATGLPPLAYLNNYRAEQAAGLLLSTDKSVAQIGSDVGWTDPSYFSQRFKAHFGVTANQYRNQFQSSA